jgi:thioredoxin reductase (NADPH)
LRRFVNRRARLTPAYPIKSTFYRADRRRNLAPIYTVSLDDDGVIALAVEDGEIHHFDLAYSAFGTTAQSQLAGALAAETDEAGRLVVDAHQQTSIAGLYAAGDVVRGLNQICVADGEAAIAATAIHNGLPKPFA